MPHKEKAPRRWDASGPSRIQPSAPMMPPRGEAVKRAKVIRFPARMNLDKNPAARASLLGSVRDAARHASIPEDASYLISARQTVDDALSAYLWPPIIRADLYAISHHLARFDADAALDRLYRLESRIAWGQWV